MKQTSDNEIPSLYQRRDWAETYDRLRFSNRGGRHVNALEVRFVSEGLADLPRGARILDMASGTGRFALHLARKGYVVTAFDSSREMLKLIGEKAVAENVDIERVEGDVRALPFEDGEFDGACCFRLLWHYDDWPSILGGLITCTRGPVVVDLMNRRSLRRWIRPFALRRAYECHTTEQEAEQLFRRNQWRVLSKQHAFGIPYILYLKFPLLAGILEKLDFWLCRKGYGTLLHYVLCRADSCLDDKAPDATGQK